VNDATQVARIVRALEALARDLKDLEEAGQGNPAVEKNALRMRGALRTLEIQFVDLEAVNRAGACT